MIVALLDPKKPTQTESAKITLPQVICNTHYLNLYLCLHRQSLRDKLVSMTPKISDDNIQKDLPHIS